MCQFVKTGVSGTKSVAKVFLCIKCIENFDADREVCRKMAFKSFFGKVLAPEYCKTMVQEKKLP